ncbi:ilvB operon leader peptide IvbL, partial [Yersinia enterocolitica]|nr:ilvB operon leader peptide IvbL [Yersinia enterocolitica]
MRYPVNYSTAHFALLNAAHVDA